MNKTIILDLLLMSLLLIVVAISQWFSDPECSSRRNPTSIHAHQDRWPETCRSISSQKQSPIMISGSYFKEKGGSPLKLDLKAETGDLVDVGYSFQLRLTNSSSRASFEGQTYLLKQFHFHKPAEHIINGKQHAMEIHFVLLRENSTKVGPKALVVGLPVDEGEDQIELKSIWHYLPPLKEGYGEAPSENLDWENAIDSRELETTVAAHHEKTLKENISVDFTRLISSKGNFYVYDGSLTTPPCDEGIVHAVSAVPIQMGHEQIEHFEGYYEGNNRDIQPTGDIVLRNFRKATVY